MGAGEAAGVGASVAEAEELGVGRLAEEDARAGVGEVLLADILGDGRPEGDPSDGLVPVAAVHPADRRTTARSNDRPARRNITITDGSFSH